MMEGQNDHFTNFSPLTSTKVGISPKNFLTFSFNPFGGQNLKVVSSVSLKLLSLNQECPPKMAFWSIPYKIEVLITSLIVMLQLPYFGHRTTSSIE